MIPFLKSFRFFFMARERHSHARNIEREKAIETEVTKTLRESFSFRFLQLDKTIKRMGGEGLEGRLIGTVASCRQCKPSKSWMGLYSPKPEIRESGLWLVQHLRSPPITETDKCTIAGRR